MICVKLICDCRIKHAIMDSNKIRGVNLRDVQFTWTGGIPRFFYDSKVNFEAADPEDWFYGYKLSAADGKGIYHPAIQYSVGKVFDAEYQMMILKNVFLLVRNLTVV